MRRWSARASQRRPGGLRIRLAILIGTALIIAVGLATLVQAASARREVLDQKRNDAARLAMLVARTSTVSQRAPDILDKAIGDQMVATARVAAQLVAVGKAAGLSDAQLTEVFSRVAATSVVKEFWITDPTGRATIHNVPVPFAFSPDPKVQPQAYVFYPLLSEPPDGPPVTQKARVREIDDEIWKYVGVPGVDKSRIVNVSVPADVIAQLRRELDVQRFADTLTGADDDVRFVEVYDAENIRVARSSADGVAPPSRTTARQLTNSARQSGRVRTATVGESLFAAAPVTVDGKDLGVVLVSVSLVEANAAARGIVNRGLLVGLLALVIGIALSYFGARRIVRPVELLTTAATDLAADEFDPAALDPVCDRTDELGELARTFRKMGSEIIERERRLREQVATLTVEIDRSRVERDVSEIVDSDFFRDLQTRAAEMRRKDRDRGPDK